MHDSLNASFFPSVNLLAIREAAMYKYEAWTIKIRTTALSDILATPYVSLETNKTSRSQMSLT